MRTSDTTDMIMEALRKAELTDPPKTATGQVRGRPDYKYADLEAILAAVRPALAAVGVTLLQDALTVDGHPAVSTRLVHAASDQWVEAGPLAMPAGDAQAVGSAITYARRYQVLAILGLAPVDDDGKAATETWEQATIKPPGAGKEVAPSPPAPGASPAVSDEGAAGTAPAAAATALGSGKVHDEPPTAGATFDQLRRLTGSAATAREQINTSNGTGYNARTVVEATEAELKLAIAEYLESHP